MINILLSILTIAVFLLIFTLLVMLRLSIEDKTTPTQLKVIDMIFTTFISLSVVTVYCFVLTQYI